ncbi:GNAT family N-acetyltransferase [bacterium]|nr:MAG: GNAT family N-acetyltransferase [bacterium]
MIETRLLTPDDAEAYWKIRLEALETVPRAFGASVETHRNTGPEAMVERLRPIEEGSFLVGAFAGSELVGTAGMVRAASGKTRHSGFVWGVYVSPLVRGQGVAFSMFETLLRRVRTYEGLERLTLDCDADSAGAMALYGKVGFKSYGLEPRALKVHDEYVDLHHMLLDLRGP